MSHSKGFIVPIIAIVIVVVLAAGIGGYMFLQYQKAQNDTPLIMLKSKCREDGKKVSGEWIKRYYQDTFLLDPQYAYNVKLRTCLYAQSYDEGITYGAFVIDAYTNQTIIEYTQTNGKQVGPISKADFNEKYKELFQTAEDFPLLMIK